MKLYNTLSKSIEEFIPRKKNVVTMYTCGPTVYHFAHIGNLRTYIMEDVLEKFLLYQGFNVRRVMNITDVGHLSSDGDTGEDKMLKGAKREHKTVMELAAFYKTAFFNDCQKLNIKIPDIVEEATAHIDDFIEIIKCLIEKGYAYESNGNVYFDTTKIDDYYILTAHEANELLTGVRNDVEEDLSKKNKTDFGLWFTKSKFDNQELKWESPWGTGYPGWHIECSAIAIKYLGEFVDIHCGGVDNIFPHHTNEIAQSEAYLGHKWCNYWFHVQHLKDSRGKMSKSSGDFLTISLLEDKGYDPMVYRLFCLQSHYRKPLTFNYEILKNSETTYKKLKERISALNKNGMLNTEAYTTYKRLFIDSIGNDINTSSALTILYDLLKDPEVNDYTKYILVKEFDSVFSLDLVTEKNASVLNADFEKYIQEKITERNLARKNKSFDRADEIRLELLNCGIQLYDTKTGTEWKKV